METSIIQSFCSRPYNPESGRFLSEDPIGFAGLDANLYRYVFNSPVTLTDPNGTVVPLILLPAIGFAAFKFTEFIVRAFDKKPTSNVKPTSDKFREAAVDFTTAVAGGVSGPGSPAIRALANPDLLNAAIILKNRERDLAKEIERQTGENICIEQK